MRSLAVVVIAALVMGTAPVVMGMGSSHDEGKPAAGAMAEVKAATAKGMPVFLDAGSDHCAPCKQMVPVIDALKKKYAGKVAVVFVNVEKEMSYVSGLGVTMIPAQIMYDRSGKEVGRHVGAMTQDEAEKFIGKGL
ncbi:MAG TPA: thioredoxin family protein [Nitrospirota bacterium]